MPYDMTQIHERLFVGSNITSVADIADLHAAGITNVIDANTDDESGMFPPGGTISLLVNPTLDDGTRKGTDWFTPAASFAIGCFIQPNAKLLCHCAAGINRGPSLAFMVLRMQGLSFIEALVRINVKRPVTVGGVRYRFDADAALFALGWITNPTTSSAGSGD